MSFEALNTIDTGSGEAVNRVIESESSVPEYIDPELDDSELFNLVDKNASTIVSINGAEMTLSEAMWLIPINKDNIYQVILMVRELLAKRTEEETEDKEPEENEIEEDPPDQNEVEQKVDPKPKVQEEIQKSKTDNSKQSSKPESAQRGPNELPAVKDVKPAGPKPAPKITAYPTAYTSTPDKPSHLTVADEVDIVVLASPTIPKPELAITAEIELAPDNSRDNIAQAAEALVRPAAEPPDTPEPVEPLLSEIGQLDILESAGSLTSGIEPAEQFDILDDVELEVPPVLDDPLEPLYFADFEEGFTVPLHQIDLDADEPTLFLDIPKAGELPEDELVNLDLSEEIISPEAPALTIEAVEGRLIQLADNLRAAQPETIEAVNVILNKIIEVPVKLKPDENQNIINEAQAQEELEELFASLLDILNIDYPPELVESLARLTLQWHLAAGIENLKPKEKADKTPPAGGTQEIIKKLLGVLKIIKKKAAQAAAIGKSAMLLCTSAVPAKLGPELAPAA